MQEITLSFNWKNSLYDMLNQLSVIEYNQNEFIFNLEFNNKEFINPDGFLLLVSCVNELKASGKNVVLNFSPSEVFDTINYASRINFFQLLNIDFNEEFIRHPSRGKFIEITHIKNNSYGLPEYINEVIINGFNLTETKAESIITLFYELIANISLHSEAENGGYLFFQKYPTREQISLMIVDSGVGIAKSLQKAYPDLNNRECLEHCLNLGVTSGNGRGQGLYIASELAVQNGGAFKILSGNDILIKRNTFKQILRYPEWQGSFLSWTFNINSSLDFDKIAENIH